MNVLIVGPLPPPFTGNSRPFLDIHNMFKERNYRIEVINGSEIYSAKSLWKVLWWIKSMIRIANKEYDIIYYSLAESSGGISRDYLMLNLLAKKNQNIYVHLLGGNNFTKKIKTSFHGVIKSYISKCKGIVVEGETQAEIFYNLGHENILINKNYVEKLNTDPIDKLQLWEGKIPLKVLYLSNMLPGKGWLEVFKAAETLRDANIEFYFAGNADSDFINTLQSTPNCEYMGFVNGEGKEDLFKRCHVFVMPTYYEYEGQPFSIIEAMSYGCLIGTTYHSGIVDIFSDGRNGKRILKHDYLGLAEWLRNLLSDKSNVADIIKNNIEQVRRDHMYDVWINNIKNFVHADLR